MPSPSEHSGDKSGTRIDPKTTVHHAGSEARSHGHGLAVSDTVSERTVHPHHEHKHHHKKKHAASRPTSAITVIATPVLVKRVSMQVKQETQATKTKARRRTLIDRQTDYVKNHTVLMMDPINLHEPKKTYEDRLNEVLDQIKPPRHWVTKNGQTWIERLCKEPTNRLDVLKLEEEMNAALAQSNTIPEGISKIRSNIYWECFDELLRQIAIRNMDHAVMLLMVRSEARMMIHSLSQVYCSRMSFAMRRVLQTKHRVSHMTKEMHQVEAECKSKQDLLKELQARLFTIQREITDPSKGDPKITAEIATLQKNNMILKKRIAELVAPNRQNPLPGTQPVKPDAGLGATPPSQAHSKLKPAKKPSIKNSILKVPN